MTKKIVVLLLVFASVPVFSENSGSTYRDSTGAGRVYDANTDEALEKTMQLLSNSNEINKLILQDSKAKKSDDRVREITQDPRQRERIYQLSAKVLKSMSQRRHGNIEEMKKDLIDGAKNPAAFANQFTEEELAELRAIASEIDAVQSSSQPQTARDSY